MGQIRNKKEIILLDNKEEESISFCPHCLEYNIYRVLRERIYLPEEITNPVEKDNWKQCHSCGTLVPIYKVKKESKLQDFIEVSDNPFDSKKTIVGLGNKKPRSSYQRQREILLERIDNEKDEEIKES